ncbi:MAG: hypothetical protein WB565_04220 [Acidimicrobiales bacterium]
MGELVGGGSTGPVVVVDAEPEAFRAADEPCGLTVNSLFVQAAQSAARTRIAPKARLRLTI